MRVLMLVRSTMLAGGEMTQIAETAAALRGRGVAVEIARALQPDVRGVDVVHLFGVNDPAEPLLQARHATRHGVPVVLSPAYQDFSEYNRRGRYGLAALAYRAIGSDRVVETVKLAMRSARAAGRRRALARLLPMALEQQQRELLAHAALVLPNSASEARVISRHFGYTGACRVVHHGAAASRFAAATGDGFSSETGLGDFVIAVGFISSLKNQLRLIAALEGTGLRLVLAGSRVPTHAAYHRAVQRAAGRAGAIMLGHVSQERLASALAAARVVALPSWFETCGLSCLEGVLAGCRVAITSRGYTRDYFGDDASYCEPGDVGSIRTAVLAAMESPAPDRLRRRLMTEMTWEAAADATLDGYQSVLRGATVHAAGRESGRSPCALPPSSRD
jgi:glycosyltransferase involved in cell wall biosynthesis